MFVGHAASSSIATELLTTGQKTEHLQMLCTGCGGPIELEWVPER